jgi:hypothetical protein
MSSRVAGEDQASACGAGWTEALDRLVLLVYEDMRRLAHRQLDWRGRRHVQTTALSVPQAAGPGGAQATNGRTDGHAARAMRQVLVDYACRRTAAKRGGD